MDRRLFVILLAALLLRMVPVLGIIWHSGYAALYQNDSDEYVGMGRALASGDVLFTGEYASWYPLFRTPGYPAFLAPFYAFGFGDIQIALAQGLMDSASCLLLFHLAALTLKDRNAAHAAAALYAANPLFISFSFQLLSEAFFVFAFLLANIVFFTGYAKGRFGERDAAMLGALLGLIIWIRPISIAFPLFYAGLLYLKQRNAKEAALILLVPMLFAGAWVARNYVVEGEATLSGTLLWNVVCYYAGFVANDPASSLQGQDYFIWRYRWWDPSVCTMLPFSELKGGLAPALGLIAQNLPVFAWHSTLGALKLFEPFSPVSHVAAALSGMRSYEVDGTMLAQEGGWLAFLPLYAAAALYQLAAYFFAAWHLRDGKARGGALFPLFAVMLAYTCVMNGPLNYARYRFPLEPFIILFAAAGITAALKARRRRSPSSPG